MTRETEIKNIILEFFQKIGFEAEIMNINIQDSLVSVKIKMDEPQILIGKRGQILSDIQHVLNRLLKRKIEENFYLDIDINDYKARKIDYLKDLARDLADEVSITKKAKQLWPMPAKERRIIHLELSNRADVATESLGEGEERRVIIKPR